MFLLMGVIHLLLNFNSRTSTTLPGGILTLFILLLITCTSVDVAQVLILFFSRGVARVARTTSGRGGGRSRVLLITRGVSQRFNRTVAILSDLRGDVSIDRDSVRRVTSDARDATRTVRGRTIVYSGVRNGASTTRTNVRRVVGTTRRASTAMGSNTRIILRLGRRTRGIRRTDGVAMRIVRDLASGIRSIRGFIKSVVRVSGRAGLLTLGTSVRTTHTKRTKGKFTIITSRVHRLSRRAGGTSTGVARVVGGLGSSAGHTGRDVRGSITSMRGRGRLVRGAQRGFNGINRAIRRLVRSVRATRRGVRGVLSSAGIVSSGVARLSTANRRITTSSARKLHVTSSAISGVGNYGGILRGVCVLTRSLGSSMRRRGLKWLYLPGDQALFARHPTFCYLRGVRG